MRPEHASIGSTDAEEIFLAELDPDPVNIGTTKGSLFERLLSPESLQWMMACGGGLLVLGFVAWLWSTGVFEQPLVVAAACGVATLAFIGSGMAMVLKTRHQLAGRWLTLVGAMAMPLNLWLYDAQGLMTLADGGHLWIPAAICCAFYAGIARVLRDSTFVYAFVGGIVLTGMLFLADQTIGRFWHWLPPAQFLIVNGWISIFAERLFTTDEKSDFSQAKFGRAFFKAGLAVVVCGLALLLGGYVSVFGSSMLVGLDFWPLKQITRDQKIWSLLLVGASAGGFFAQGILRKSKTCHWSAIALIVSAALIGINLLSISITTTLFAILAATLVIARNLIGGVILTKKSDSLGVAENWTGNVGSQLVVGLLSLLAMVQTLFHLEGWTLAFAVPPVTLWSVLQFALTTVAAWTLAWRIRLTGRADSNNDGLVAAGGIVAMLAVWGAATMQSVFDAQLLAIVTAAAPLALISLGAFVLKDSPLFKAASASQNVAVAMMSTHFALLVGCNFHPTHAGTSTHVVWIVSLGIASVVYALASRSVWPTVNKVLSLATAIGSIAVSGHFLGFDFAYCAILAPALIGTGIKLLHFFIGESPEAVRSKRNNPLVSAANFIVLQSGMAGVLLAMSRWLSSDVSGTLLIVMMTVLGCTVVSSFLTRNAYWLSVFRGLIVAIVASNLCALDGLMGLTGWHRGEICSLVGGAILLVLGHLAWVRENDDDADAVATVSLFAGSLLIAIPLAIGVIFYRTVALEDSSWRLFHEIATVASSLILLAAGILCRVRSTTIAGATLMLAYVGSLVTLIRISGHLQNASVVMMVGGGAFLAFAILMSIYRDRLVAIPKQVAEGEGVFQVLKWR